MSHPRCNKLDLAIYHWSFEFIWPLHHHLAALHQRPRSDRAVRIGGRQLEKAVEQGSCGGGVLRWAGTTDWPRFAACCGCEAERLEIAEPPCERILDQTWRQ